MRSARAVGRDRRDRGGDRGRRVHDERVAGAQVLRQIGERRRARRRCRRSTRAAARRRGRGRALPAARAPRAPDRAGSTSAERSSTAVMTRPPTTRVRPLGLIRLDQRDETGRDRGGQRTVGDVFAGERVLVHLGAHVAGIDHEHAHVGMLGREHRRQLLERGLRRSVAAPTFVGLDRGVGRDVHDRAVRRDERRQQLLRQRERRDHVDLVDAAEHVEIDRRRARAAGSRPTCSRC